MDYLVNQENVLALLDRAATAATVCGGRHQWRDTAYRRTFDARDIDLIDGALGWLLAAAGIQDILARRELAFISSHAAVPTYHLWPPVRINGCLLIEPDLRVLRTIDAACDATAQTALTAATEAYQAASAPSALIASESWDSNVLELPPILRSGYPRLATEDLKQVA